MATERKKAAPGRKAAPRKRTPPRRAPDEPTREDSLRAARGYASDEGTLGTLSRALLRAEEEAGAAAAELARLSPEGRRFGVLVARPTWLADTERLQLEVFRLEPRTLPYIRLQVTAAIVELAEVLQALPWKSARDGLDQGAPADLAAVATPRAIDAARGEVVDAAHFIANTAVALGFTDDTFWEAYNRKSCLNVERRRKQERGERVDFP